MKTSAPEARGPAPAEDPRGLRTRYLQLRNALFDPITGLPSYALQLDRLEMQCAGLRVGVILLEFPRFALLERTLGWEAADRFLAGVAEVLRSCKGTVYPHATLLGLEGVYGDSFTMLLAQGRAGGEVGGDDLADACRDLSLRLAAALAAAPWSPPLPASEFSIGRSLVVPNPSARFERMVHQGIRDARTMTLRETDRIQDTRAGELRELMRAGRLTTHYQPIVDMDLDQIMGYEALTRGPENTPLEVPKALFSVSEDSRLSGELDALCRQNALRNARGFDPDKKLFLNSLPEALGTPGLIERNLTGVLEEVALRPNNLVLEITERTAIEDFESFGRELDRLRRLGYLVAIDDVGTGYSSLQTISEVPADFLKIDMSLIQNIHRSLIKQDLVHSLLQVASRTRARVIAEGIETGEECRALRACGVRYGQGFYFARPAPAFPALSRSLRDGRPGA